MTRDQRWHRDTARALGVDVPDGARVRVGADHTTRDYDSEADQ